MLTFTVFFLVVNIIHTVVVILIVAGVTVQP